jgi:hypothetical protein
MGASSPPAAGAAAPSQQPPQPLPQQVSQQERFLQQNRPNSPPQHLRWQQLSQQGCSQQAASQQAGCSQQAASQQAGSQQLWQRGLQQSNSPFRPQNRPHRLWQQVSQQLSQQGFSQQAASQHGFSQQAASQQAGCSQQAASQQAGSQQLLQHPPQCPPPSIRSSSSKPKLWLQSVALTTSAPKNSFHFIEQRLLHWNCGAHPQRTLLGQEPLLLTLATGESPSLVARSSNSRTDSGAWCCLSVGKLGRNPAVQPLYRARAVEPVHRLDTVNAVT